MLLVEPTVVLPDTGNELPIPSIVTDAFGSDDCQESVTGVPEHTLFFDSESVTVGSTHAPDDPDVPGGTARRRLPTGGGLGAAIGAKLIPVTG
ncbi:MAG: hypothetical protein QOE68_3452 [Thermoanaerobaculia bacterium]|jgi:hypothetical protein|nr:hypothetical protein [Thermoanaerobaculia bacterium]